MNDRIAIADLDAVFDKSVVFPTVVLWNRLEGRPRRTDFQRALRAEVRDPLWMLCKQWQVGEFKGDDAASPVSAKLHLETNAIDGFRPGAAEARAFDSEKVLEATVEQRPVPLLLGGLPHALDRRLAMGRQWRKMLNDAGLAAHFTLFRDRFPVLLPDAGSPDHATLTAHPDVWKRFMAASGRAIDGGALYRHLEANPANRPYDGTALPDADKPAIDALSDRFKAWYKALFMHPEYSGNDAWDQSRLEYRFALSAPKDGGSKVMVAEEYYHGSLDWYNLDIDRRQADLGPGSPAPAAPPDKITRAFLPTGLQFEGMPNTRWWSFEDGKTNFGDIAPDTTDLAKLLLIEFGLIYANDWFLLPIDMPVGTVADVRGLAVTNVFGERTWVQPAGAGAEKTWQRWAMFGLASKEAGGAADTSLVLLPSVPKIQEGKPFDDIRLVRDEVANMVCAVEARVPLATGASRPGTEVGRELARRHTALLDAEIETGTVLPNLPDPSAAIRYRVMRGVPENWIPFLPVRVPGSDREIQLQRASMPRIIEGAPPPPAKIKPRTVLLRSGLDQLAPEPYFLHEEEVPRAGVRVTQAFQRTRWSDGQVRVWVGVRKTTGRGEGHSGLAFDRVEPTRAQLRPELRRFRSGG